MKYFWQAFGILAAITVIIFIFFAFSVRTKNAVTFTGLPRPTTPEVTSADPQVGPQNAPVTLVDYGDYQCPACAELESTIVALRAQYGDKLRIVWKDMPNASVHPEALHAALAARCADKQKKFWEYHALLFANQSLLGSDLYMKIAGQLKLNTDTFNRCLTNQDTLPFVQRGFDEGTALGLSTTPTVYLNGKRYDGDLTQGAMSRAIDLILKK